MARILLDTDAMAGMAGTLRDVQHELDAAMLRLAGEAAVVMPPATAAEVAGNVAAAGAGLRRVSADYGRLAGELDRRRLSAGLLEGGGLGAGGLAGLVFRALASHGGVPALPPWARSAWQRAADGVDGPLDYANPLHDAVDTLDLISSNVPVSTLNRYDAWSIRVGESGGFRLFGNGLAVLGGIQDATIAWHDGAEENWLGRGITVAGSVASDVAFTKVPVLAGANFMSGGALRADAAALFTMEGAAASQGLDRAVAAYRADRASGDYLGLGWDVGTAALGGAASGAEQGLDTWSQDVADGRYGGLMAGLSHVEDRLIDDHYDQFANVAHKTAGAVSGVGHTVSGFVHKLF